MFKFIAIVGLTGSGKTTVSEIFKKEGYQFIRFGQVVLDEIIRKKLHPLEKYEKVIREEIRKKYGMAAVAKLNYPKILKMLKKGPVVADGVYSFSEYKFLKKKFGENMKVISVFAPPSIRYERLQGRTLLKKDKKLQNRPASVEDAEKRDFHEIEKIEKGGPIAMADYTILNTKELRYLKKQLEEIQIDLKKVLK